MILAKLKNWADTFMAEFVQQTEAVAEGANEAKSKDEKDRSNEASSSLSGQRTSLIAHAIGSVSLSCLAPIVWNDMNAYALYIRTPAVGICCTHFFARDVYICRFAYEH